MSSWMLGVWIPRSPPGWAVTVFGPPHSRILGSWTSRAGTSSLAIFFGFQTGRQAESGSLSLTQAGDLAGLAQGLCPVPAVHRFEFLAAARGQPVDPRHRAGVTGDRWCSFSRWETETPREFLALDWTSFLSCPSSGEKPKEGSPEQEGANPFTCSLGSTSAQFPDEKTEAQLFPVSFCTATPHPCPVSTLLPHPGRPPTCSSSVPALRPHQPLSLWGVCSGTVQRPGTPLPSATLS
jgi:hypothetical protein